MDHGKKKKKKNLKSDIKLLYCGSIDEESEISLLVKRSLLFHNLKKKKKKKWEKKKIFPEFSSYISTPLPDDFHLIAQTELKYRHHWV